MQEGGREEVTALGGGGGAGSHIQGIWSLWAPPGGVDLLPIPGAGGLVGGQRLAGGGQEIVTGEGSVEEDGKGPRQGGGGSAGIWIFL